jgi:hypothetical protein
LELAWGDPDRFQWQIARNPATVDRRAPGFHPDMLKPVASGYAETRDQGMAAVEAALGRDAVARVIPPSAYRAPAAEAQDGGSGRPLSASGTWVDPRYRLGHTRAAYPSPGALEEALGFPLPSAVRAALEAERTAHPALAFARGMDVGTSGVGEIVHARNADTFPVWSSEAVTAERGSLSWGLAVERDRQDHAAVVDLGEGTELEVLGARPEPGTGSALVSYRLSQAGRVVLAGDDVRAPAGVDVAADDSLRALLAVLADPAASQRSREFGPAQRAFLAAHGDRLLDAASGPPGPYPYGTRVAVDVDGRRHLGTVRHPVLGRDGAALAYSWSPDVAALVGHPWRGGLSGEGEPERTLITPASKVTATLAAPEIGAPGPGQALAFGAIVAAAHPDTGQRVEATVLRAFGGGDGIVYQVEPHTLEDTEPFTLPAGDAALVRGTWWPNVEDLMAARQRAGIGVVPGEILAGTQGGSVSVAAETAETPPTIPEVTPAQQAAALLVGVNPIPPLATVDVHGEIARVGDPSHGWLVVPTERLFAGMARSGGDLRAILADAAPGVSLNGDEPVPTLAALVAEHAPDRLDREPAPTTTRPVRRLAAVPDVGLRSVPDDRGPGL